MLCSGLGADPRSCALATFVHQLAWIESTLPADRPLRRGRGRPAALHGAGPADRGRTAPSCCFTAPRPTSPNPCSASATRSRALQGDRLRPTGPWLERPERRLRRGRARPAGRAHRGGPAAARRAQGRLVVGHSWRARSCRISPSTTRDVTGGDPDPVGRDLPLARGQDRLVSPPRPTSWLGWLVHPHPRDAGRRLDARWVASRKRVRAAGECRADYPERQPDSVVLRPADVSANAAGCGGALCGGRAAQSPRYRDIRMPAVVIGGDADQIVWTDLHARSFARRSARRRARSCCRASATCRNTWPDLMSEIERREVAPRTELPDAVWQSRDDGLSAARRSDAGSGFGGVFRADEGDAHHVGGARRAEGHAGHDDDAVAHLREALADGEFAGAERHVVEVARILGADRMHAPDQRQAAGRVAGSASGR